MKTTLIRKLLPVILTLYTTQVYSHPGHLTDDTVHGLLHVEHIVALAALGVVAYVVTVLRNK